MDTITKRKLSIEEYHRMCEVGIIGPEERVELINGEILEMSDSSPGPIGDKHLGIVSRINDLLTPRLTGKYIVHVQSPVKLGNNSEPEPDLIITPYRNDYYTTTGIHPEDVRLLIEVSDTSLRKDIDLKVPVYAEVGIPEVWVIDLQHNQVIQFTDLTNQKLNQAKTWARDDKFSSTQLPLELYVKDLIG